MISIPSDTFDDRNIPASCPLVEACKDLVMYTAHDLSILGV